MCRHCFQFSQIKIWIFTFIVQIFFATHCVCFNNLITAQLLKIDLTRFFISVKEFATTSHRFDKQLFPHRWCHLFNAERWAAWGGWNYSDIGWHLNGNYIRRLSNLFLQCDIPTSDLLLNDSHVGKDICAFSLSTNHLD